jgi:aminoglycoside 6'-N-acetyltransferase I
MEEFIILDDSYLPEMAELFKNSFSGEPWNDNWSDSVQLMEYVKEISGGYNALNYGLFRDGKLAAMSLGMIRHWWEGTNYNIEELCVSPDLQGQGIGTHFMRLIEDAISGKGLCGIFLQTDNDKPSYRFYQKNGFKELSSHVSFYKSVRK